MGAGLDTFELDDGRWAGFVEHHPDAIAFHHPAWAGALARCYGFRPFVLAALDDTGGVAAGLPLLEVNNPLQPRRWIALAFTDHCPVLGIEAVGAAEFGAALVDLRASRTDVPRIDVRSALPGGYPVSDSVLHVLSLIGGIDDVYRGFHANQVKRNIRRAEREGVEVDRGTSSAYLLDIFYRLHVQTRRRLGVPVQSKRFFRVLWESVISQGLGFVSVARLHGEPIAAAVFLTHNGTLIYKYGASDARAWPVRGNHLMFWDAIQWACASGYRALDFGLSGVEDEGLRAFKSHWGAPERPLVYSVFANDAPPAASGRALRVAGAVIKRSPPALTRMLGTLFYRYGA
jgi:hypothetical protein